MSLTKVTYSMIAGPVINVVDYGATGNGTTDDTAAIQAAIDQAYNNGGGTVTVPPGTYAVTGVKVYGIWSDFGVGTVLSGNATYLQFQSGAVFKMTANSGFVIRTAKNPSTVSAPFTDDELLYGVLENVTIDMDSKGDAGILLEAAHYWSITSPDIRNVPAGTFSYNDGSPADSPTQAYTYPKSGIIVKGITNIAGSFNNKIETFFIRGARVSGVNVKGQCGVYMSATGTKNDQRPNFNTITNGSVANLETGIDVEQGFNQTLESVNAFSNTTCFRINTGRNAIIKPYIESSTTGIFFTGSSGFNTVYNLSSVASTTTPIDDQGIDNALFPENYFPRFGALSTAGSSTTGQVIPPNTWTKILLDSVRLAQTKIASITDLANNSFKIDAAGDGEGLYLILGTVRVPTVEDGKLYEVAIYVNGLIILPYASTNAGGTSVFNLQTTSYAVLEKDDTVELWFRHNNTANITLADSAQTQLFVVKQMYNLNKPLNR